MLIPFCDTCGSKLSKSNSKFCPNCGANMGGKAAQPQQAATQANPQSEAAKATGPSDGWKTAGIILGLAIGAIIIFGFLGSNASNYTTTTSGSEGSQTGTRTTTSGSEGNQVGTTPTCTVKAGSVSCGYCDPNIALSGSPYAGMCRSCPSGTTCSGDICGNLTCKRTSQVSDGGTATSAAGNNQQQGNGGGVITNFPFDSRTGCPVEGSTSSYGSVNFECSQMVPAGRCAFQGCTCYYSGVHGDTGNAYYHSSDGAYFPCSGNEQTGLDCRAAAQAVVSHCSPN